MRCLGRVVLFCIVSVLLMLWGCYKPYTYEEYVVVDGPPANYMGENMDNYPNFTAEGIVVMVSFAGESDNDAPYVQHGPYEVCFAAWRKRQGSRAPIVSIESLSVHDQTGLETEVVFNNTPVVLSFIKYGDSFESASMRFRKKLDLQPKSGKLVYVTMIIKVDSDQSCTRTQLKYEFIQKVIKGRFRLWII